MQNLYPYAKKIAVAAFVVLLIASAFYLVARLTQFFLLVFAGILLAVLFTSLTEWLSAKTGMRRGLSLTIIIVLIFGGLIGLGILIAPTVERQVEEMTETIPQAWEDLKGSLRGSAWGDRVLEEIEDGKEKMLPESRTAFSRLSGMFASTLGILTDILIIVITGVFLASNPTLYTGGFIRLFPVAKRTRYYRLLNLCYETLRRWLWGMFLAMCLIGFSIWIGFSIIGLQLALLMAMLAFFFAFIPNIGPIIAGVPPVLLAFLDSPQMALNVLIIYAVIQGIEGYILTPIIFEKTVDLPPALLLFFQVLLGILEGGLGLLLAAPLMAVGMVVVNELYVKDLLERNAEQRSAPDLPEEGAGGSA